MPGWAGLGWYGPEWPACACGLKGQPWPGLKATARSNEITGGHGTRLWDTAMRCSRDGCAMPRVCIAVP